MALEKDIRTELSEEDFTPAERIGQHILVDQKAQEVFIDQIEYGCNVLEIGAGPGNLTRLIAQKARKVVTIELDTRFRPFLCDVQSSHPNVEVVYQNALAVNFRKVMEAGGKYGDWQVASSLPFHISEPFLHKLAGLPIESAVLIVGDKLARKMRIENPDSIEYSRLALLTQTFFEPHVVFHLTRDTFYPPPRTDASIVVLNPRQKEEFERNTALSTLRRLFLSGQSNASVLKIIKDSQEDQPGNNSRTKTERHRFDRRQFRVELTKLTRNSHYGFGETEMQRFPSTRPVTSLGIPEEILNKPFSKLDNHEIRVLVKALRSKYGQI